MWAAILVSLTVHQVQLPMLMAIFEFRMPNVKDVIPALLIALKMP